MKLNIKSVLKSLLFLIFIIVSGCSKFPPDSIPEDKIGLSNVKMEDTADLLSYRFYDDDYRMPKKKPAYRGSPPVIRHDINDYLPITMDENPCMECHKSADEGEVDKKTTPDSHYYNYRFKPGVKGKKLYGARYLCISCHVVNSDAKPLVGNTFKSLDGEGN